MKPHSERRVKVAELKAKLSEYVRAARRGEPITVCDRETPVARLVPFDGDAESLPVRMPTRSLAQVVFPAPINTQTDSLAALVEERQSSR